MNLECWFECFFENIKDVFLVVVIDGIILFFICEGFYKGIFNFYVWMLLLNVLIYIENICKVLVEYDFVYVEIYNCNVKVYVEKIVVLDVLLCECLF